MNKLLLGIVTVFLLTACSSGNPFVHTSPSPRVVDSTCADKFEQTLNTGMPLDGAYGCMSPNLQKWFTNTFGVNDDNTFAEWSSQYKPYSVVGCGEMIPYDANHNVKVYLASPQDPSGYAVLARVFVLATTGQVDAIQTASTHSQASVILKNEPTCASTVPWPHPTKQQFGD